MDLNLADVIDMGLSGVLLFLLLRRESKFDSLIERLLGYLEQARLDRHKMQSELTALRLDKDRRNPPDSARDE